jgi:hypothetical protein
VTKNTAAKTAVVRDKKLAPPVAPNKLPEPPLPKAAPMSAPLPCCTKIKPIIANADIGLAWRSFEKTFYQIEFTHGLSLPQGAD